jgi:cyclohexadienyl dehydratase
MRLHLTYQLDPITTQKLALNDFQLSSKCIDTYSVSAQCRGTTALTRSAKLCPLKGKEDRMGQGQNILKKVCWLSVVLGLALLSFNALAAERSSLLDKTIKQGYILVGTTGDYKPFTFLNPTDSKFEGIDIDMALALGHALGVEVKFVKTSWPTLMKDFQEAKFDLGMGGISVNLERQKKGFFSIPYLVDGKTPITLKENVSKFQTLEQIDQPGVRVIVNPGGTNEKFDRANLKKATIIVYQDNVTIFDQIVEGKADLMITDAVETLLQQKLHPQLEAVHPDKPFTYSEKGYLMPQDIVFKLWVDQWLHLALKDGTFHKIYDTWLK